MTNVLKKTKPPRAASSHGLVLSLGTLKALQKRGIYCTPGVSLEHQHLARRYVLRGGRGQSRDQQGTTSMTHPNQAAVTVGEPNWAPLDRAVPAAELENFMYMGY